MAYPQASGQRGQAESLAPQYLMRTLEAASWGPGCCIVDMRGWLRSSLERRCRILFPRSPNSAPPKSPVPPWKELVHTHLVPSFCRSHPRDRSSDHLALIASRICIHKSHRTVANKKVFKGHRCTPTPCPSSYSQRVWLLISLHLGANCGPTPGDADTLNSWEPLRTKEETSTITKVWETTRSGPG